MAISRIFGLLLALFLTACSSAQLPLIQTGPRYIATPTGPEDYRLAAGDKVRLTVFNENSLSGEFSVASNGSVSFPLIGEMPADGKTTTELATATQAKFGAGYLRDPKISIEVVSYRPFFVLGEVSAPGQYPFASGMTALNAVATAQGFTPRAERKVIYIRRANGAAEEAYSLTPDLRVWPGDTLRIGERFF